MELLLLGQLLDNGSRQLGDGLADLLLNALVILLAVLLHLLGLELRVAELLGQGFLLLGIEAGGVQLLLQGLQFLALGLELLLKVLARDLQFREDRAGLLGAAYQLVDAEEGEAGSFLGGGRDRDGG